jgi:hypothetical protein
MGRARVASAPDGVKPVIGVFWIERAKRLPAKTSAGLLIFAATILRLALASFGRYDTDSTVLAFRSLRLAQLPPRALYATNQGVIDHLPGDLWFLWYASNFYSALVPYPNFHSHTFLIVTKAIPILADAGAAFALFLLARDLAGPTAGVLAAALYAFNPGPIFVASIWDQWDSISVCALLFSVWFFLRRRFALAAAALTYASIIKPQYSALGLLFALAYIRWHIFPVIQAARARTNGTTWPRALFWPVARVIGAIAAAIGTAAAVLVPFGVGFWPLHTQFDIWERLHFVYLIHDETSLNAFTVWATPLAGNGVNDWSLHFLGWDTGTWGRILLAAGLLAVLGLWWRRGTERAFIWACLATTFCLFMLPTRIHERYLLPTVAFAALAAALQPRRLWFFLSITAMFTINVVAVFWMAHASLGAPFFGRRNPWVMLASTINVGLLGWVLWRGLPGADETEPARWRLPWAKTTVDASPHTIGQPKQSVNRDARDRQPRRAR